MNMEIGTEAPIFLFWEHMFQIFDICLCSAGPTKGSQGRTKISCTCTTILTNQPRKPRKDHCRLYSLSPHSPQFQQSARATPPLSSLSGNPRHPEERSQCPSLLIKRWISHRNSPKQILSQGEGGGGNIKQKRQIPPALQYQGKIINILMELLLMIFCQINRFIFSAVVYYVKFSNVFCVFDVHYCIHFIFYLLQEFFQRRSIYTNKLFWQVWKMDS